MAKQTHSGIEIQRRHQQITKRESVAPHKSLNVMQFFLKKRYMNVDKIPEKISHQKIVIAGTVWQFYCNIFNFQVTSLTLLRGGS